MSEKKKICVILADHEKITTEEMRMLVENIKHKVGYAGELEIQFITKAQAVDLKSVEDFALRTVKICNELVYKTDVVLKTKNVHQTIRKENRFRSNQHRGKI
jgi:hypothetical protein